MATCIIDGYSLDTTTVDNYADSHAGDMPAINEFWAHIAQTEDLDTLSSGWPAA